ncbi:MAG: hypothetical protein FRX49_06930 [Trebouxia sp. A1-2]|nr:MAG: hypothetical protein FRX49_06930 [Trebouxia sp. A1-2]
MIGQASRSRMMLEGWAWLCMASRHRLSATTLCAPPSPPERLCNTYDWQMPDLIEQLTRVAATAAGVVGFCHLCTQLSTNVDNGNVVQRVDLRILASLAQGLNGQHGLTIAQRGMGSKAYLVLLAGLDRLDDFPTSQHAAAVKLAAAVKYGELKQENFVQHQGMKRQGIHKQHPGDQISSPRRQMARQVVDATLDLLEKIGNIFIIKGQTATQKCIENDATAPYIDFRTTV